MLFSSQDNDFRGAQRAHNNPNAEVWTSLQIYKEYYSIERAYMGESVFWAVSPQANDLLTITFNPPIFIEK